jgi:pimeloyl-ACP methyl ester carboxylesterase
MKRLTRYALVIVAFLAALLPLSSAAAAPTNAALTPSTVKSSTVKPTIVLVHGAFADSSSWDTDIAALRHLGFPVVAVANPLRSLTSDAAYVHAILQSIKGPIVLVGHSYGGAVIGNAAVGIPNVKALVFVAAFILDQGESVATTPDPKQFPGSLVGPDTTVATPVPNPAAPGGLDAEITIKPEDFRAVFAADVPADKAALMAVTQRPFAVTAITQPSGPPAWKTIPSWALIALNDKAIDPNGERFMAERAHAHIETVRSSHAVMVSHPLEVLHIILEAAAATS